MNSTQDDVADDDPRLFDIARDYLAELEAGRVPDREAFIERHPELRDQIEECLAGIDLAHAAGGMLAPAADRAEVPAEPLGDFRILREIGRGGMGVVYEATQLSLGRKVALKVLPFAAALDPRHLHRFRTEAHAAAQLHHTNIVPVYGVGCERGMHFYAMQLIEGQSLEMVIRTLRQEAGRPAAGRGGVSTVVAGQETTSVASVPVPTGNRTQRDRESFRTAAKIAAQAADALDYAHDNGVVHRDIKPANLLLDAHGRVWITDFGLAQVAADVGMTRTGDILGTLRYMSPEQAAGRKVVVDHRTDVYSLGATLYELLTLEPIFPGQDRATLLRSILDEEPRALRRHDRAIPLELETIVLKAVAKSPADRYASAGEMAADLRRFLEERPILARRPTLVERTRKWLRRHPGFLVAATLFLLCGLVGLGTGTAFVAREQARTREAYDREKERAEEAEKRFGQARQAVDLLVRISEEELGDHPAMEEVRRRLLEAALDYYQDLQEEQQRGEATQAELRASREHVRRLLDELATLQVAHLLYLVNDPEVQKELKIDQEQKDRLVRMEEVFAQRRFERFAAFRPGRPESFRKVLLEETRKQEAALKEILTAMQENRFRQIVLQQQGPRAFHEPQVVAALALTPDQKDAIRNIERTEALRFEPKFPGEPGMKPPPWEPGGWMRKRFAATVARIVATLSPDQQERWQAIIGPTFEANLRFPEPPPFGRFGPKGKDRP